jgi:hypothetical protein
VQKDLLVNASREKHACEISTRSDASTQDPLYPEGHPKRIEQDSQRAIDNGTLSRKKKKKQTVVESSESIRDPNSVSISDAETGSVVIKMILLIKKKLKRNLKIILRVQSTLRKILLPINIAVSKNLGCQNQGHFLTRNTNQRRKNTTTSFVS